MLTTENAQRWHWGTSLTGRWLPPPSQTPTFACLLTSLCSSPCFFYLLIFIPVSRSLSIIYLSITVPLRSLFSSLFCLWNHRLPLFLAHILCFVPYSLALHSSFSPCFSLLVFRFPPRHSLSHLFSLPFSKSLPPSPFFPLSPLHPSLSKTFLVPSSLSLSLCHISLISPPD